MRERVIFIRLGCGSKHLKSHNDRSLFYIVNLQLLMFFLITHFDDFFEKDWLYQKKGTLLWISKLFLFCPFKKVMWGCSFQILQLSHFSDRRYKILNVLWEMCSHPVTLMSRCVSRWFDQSHDTRGPAMKFGLKEHEILRLHLKFQDHSSKRSRDMSIFVITCPKVWTHFS